MKSFVVLVCVALCGMAGCNQVPFITPCRITDTECLKGTVETILPALADGIPDMGIAPLDPMYVERMQATAAGLDMDFRKTTVKGVKQCKVLNMRVSGSQVYLDLKCSINLEGDYTLGGQILLLPVEGTGTYEIKITDIVVKIQFELGEKMENGEKYWTIKSWDHSYDVPENVQFQFNNMFNGNTWLATPAHYFANQNWRLIFQKASPPIVKAIVTQILDQINKLLNSVPVKEYIIE